MDSSIASYVLQYSGYLIEGGLLLYLAWTKQWKKQRGIIFYLTALLVAELGRAYAGCEYGLSSRQYFYVYWCTDFPLVLSTFLLVWLFFRRACCQEERMWRYIRLVLALAVLLVAGISAATLSSNQHSLFSFFTVEFNQNLYFTCLVLNTLLYILLQQIQSTDEQLGLLVCGVGVQFAGPAAALALDHLTGGEQFAQSLVPSIMRLCTLGMLLVWGYAITHVKASKVVSRNPVLAEIHVD